MEKLKMERKKTKRPKRSGAAFLVARTASPGSSKTVPSPAL
jgi:hypothetical protein